MRGLQRRRVVDAVAGHRDDFAVRLQRVDDAQLLLRHDAREHVGHVDPLRELGVGQLRELGAGQHGAWSRPAARAIACAVAG